jgi:putative sigma-54 modulation protein
VQIIVKGRNIELTTALKAHAEEKISKIDRYFERGTKIEIELSVEKNPSISDNQTVEVNVFADHSTVIRAKQSSSDMYASIDMMVDKLGKRLKKLKDKTDSRHNKHHKETIRGNGVTEADLAMMSENTETEEDSDETQIVKRKQFSVKPMTPEEAAMEMDLLGHSFFFFTNSETETPNVIYKRRDGNVGLIEPS